MSACGVGPGGGEASGPQAEPGWSCRPWLRIRATLSESDSEPSAEFERSRARPAETGPSQGFWLDLNAVQGGPIHIFFLDSEAL